jgi:hypothetical protein
MSFAVRIAVASLLIALGAQSAQSHEIYSGVHGKDGQLCCGGSDCKETVYRERAGHYFVLTREEHWIEIPEDRITFLPIPGDDPNEKPVSDEYHRAHLCYRGPLPDGDWSVKSHDAHVFSGDGESIWLYCMFIPPGAT